MTLPFEGEPLAPHRRLYPCDAVLPPLPDDHAEAALARRVAASAGAMVVHAGRALGVPLRVDLLEARPDPDPARVDHVAECGLGAPSGILVVAGLPDEVSRAARLRVPAGRLRALVPFENLGRLGQDGQDGLDGDDRHAVRLWPGSGPPGVVVLRQWPASQTRARTRPARTRPARTRPA